MTGCRYPRQGNSPQHQPLQPPCPPFAIRSVPSAPPPLRRQQGASRLEFGVVVVVAGVLMTLALQSVGPWQQRLRELRLAQALAAVQAADALYHARCVQSATRPCRITLADGQVVADAQGHPAATADGMARAADLASLGVQWREWRQHELPMLTVFVPTPVGAGCEFTYVQASTWGAQPGIDRHSASCP